MAQPITASFITDTGFATGLTPKLEISDILGNVLVTTTMTETRPGNYVYNFNEYNPDVVYFFNYDADDDNVINRYQANNNNTPSVLYQMAGGGGTNARVEDTKKKEKELIEKISKEVKKELEDWYNKQVETLGMIVKNTDISHIENLSGTILSSIENNSEVIQKSIDLIDIPKYDESKVIKAIKDIKPTDIKPLIDKLDKVYICCEDTEEEVDNVKNILMMEYNMEEYVKKEKEAEDMITEMVEDEMILESLQD